MANQGEPVPNHAVQQHIRHAGIPGHGDRHHLLDAARALMLLGAVAAVSTTAGADAGPQVFLGLVTWLLGVYIVSFVPVAGRLFPAVVQGKLDHDHLLDAVRALMLLGVGAAAAVLSNVGKNNLDADSAAQVLVFLALVTWLLGVCLLSLVPVAGRFPRAAALAGAAIANASSVLGHLLFTPWN